MSYASIRMEKLTPHIGAEIHGVDLADPLDERTFKEVHDALVEHGVIFFRDQHISPEQQKAFGRLFGELHMHPAAPSLLEGHPEILVIHADEKSKRVAGRNGTPTSPATPSLRWAASSTCTSCRPSAATRSSPACTRRTTRSRTR